MISTLNGAFFNVNLRFLLVLLTIVLTAPFWLPAALGGNVRYHNVLTSSMTGTADRGSMVVIMPQAYYASGDVVAFVPPYATNQLNITVLHRIVGVNENGRYLIKGDVTNGIDVVAPEYIVGRMMLSIPYVGFFAGAARVFPLIALVVILSLLFVGRGDRVSEPGCNPVKGGGYFLIAAGVLALALPLASMGLAENGNKFIAIAVVSGLLVTTRLMEIAFPKEIDGYVELLYVAVVAAGLSMVYVPGVVESFRDMFWA